METYTVAKILFSKEVEGKFGPQQNIRFTTNETGEKSLSCFSKFPLKEGQQITGSIVEKPGMNKEGQPVIYYNFNFAKKEGGPVGMSAESIQMIMRELRTHTQILNDIKYHVDPDAKITSAGTKVPDFTAATMNVAKVEEPPVETYAEEGFTDEDFPKF